MEDTHVVTVFLRHETDVLLLKRSDEVGSYPGLWAAVAGHVETAEGDHRDSMEAALAEIEEETGIQVGQVTPVRTGEPFPVDDAEYGRWVVHPFLFDSSTRAVETNRETAEWEWVAPTDILRRATVPELWPSYERVAPTAETVATDTEHGSAYVSLRALEVLRDRAAVLATGRRTVDDEWADLEDVARDLLDARPSMQVVTNRVNRVMHGATTTWDTTSGDTTSGDRTAVAGERTPAAVEESANRVIEAALGADAAAAATAADHVEAVGKTGGSHDTRELRVLTLSRSGTVLEALRRAATTEVLVAESRPAREGVDVAEELASESPDTDVTLFVDAAVAHVLSNRDVDAVLVGADAVLPDGGVSNKVGTRTAALAAARESVPVHVVTARDKVSPGSTPEFEAGDPRPVYDGDADLSVLAPRFDLTPPDLVDGVLTENGLLDPADVADVADEMAELADWTGTAGETEDS